MCVSCAHVCGNTSDENAPTEKKAFWSTRRKYGRPWSSAVLFQPVPHLGHTRMHTHTRLEQGLLQNSIDLCL